MAKKKDPSVTYLNKFGYNVIKLPRVGIEPMDVVGKDETTQWLGPLRSVWKSSISEPPSSAPKSAASVNGQQTDKLNISFGLKILANALTAFGAAVPSLDVAYQRARSVTFAFTNVTSVGVPLLDAGNYLANGTLNTESPVVQHYFRNPDAQAYLITEVLKSDTITVTAQDDSGEGIDLDIPAIQSIVGAKVGVKFDQSRKGTVQYSGKEAVTFGFIANDIEFDGNKWAVHGIKADGDHAFGLRADAGGAATVAAKQEAPVLLSTACLVRL